MQDVTQEIDINFTSLRQDAHCTRGFGSGGSFLSHDHVQRTDRLTDKAREGTITNERASAQNAHGVVNVVNASARWWLLYSALTVTLTKHVPYPFG